MDQRKKFNWVTDRRVQGVALLLIAAAGLRQATLAGSSPATTPAVAPPQYPLIAVARDFRSGHSDFVSAAADSLPTSVGNLSKSLDANGRPVFAGGGMVLTSPARDSAGRNIMPAAVTAAPVTNFNINGATVTSTQPVAVKVTFVGAAMVTAYGIGGRVNVGNTVHTPFGVFDGNNAANLNDRSSIEAILPGIVTPNTPITVDGRSWRISDHKVLMTINSANGGAQVVALRNGNAVPKTSGFSGQASAKTMLSPYLNAAKTHVVLQPNQIIYLFELGVSDKNSTAFDMQDLIVLVDLASDPSYFQPQQPPAVTDSCGNVVNDTAATFGAANNGGIFSNSSFSQWFSDVPGTNVSQRIVLNMVKDAAGVYSYTATDFTPIDGEMYGNQNAAHNRGFTCSVDAVSNYKSCGGQFIEYAGSNDGWLFVNGKLAMDLGGTHADGKQTVLLDRLGLTDGSEVRIQFFYAQRTSANAKFSLRTNMVLSTSHSVGLPGVSGILD